MSPNEEYTFGIPLENFKAKVDVRKNVSLFIANRCFERNILYYNIATNNTPPSPHLHAKLIFARWYFLLKFKESRGIALNAASS